MLSIASESSEAIYEFWVPVEPIEHRPFAT
jgi:hypothetical protein